MQTIEGMLPNPLGVQKGEWKQNEEKRDKAKPSHGMPIHCCNNDNDHGIDKRPTIHNQFSKGLNRKISNPYSLLFFKVINT
jgi:hypothetical protein